MEFPVRRLLQAQTHAWNHIFSFIDSMSLKTAIDLNIPEIIYNYGKPMPLSLLISSLGIHLSKSQNLYRLMRILTHSGFFSLQKLPEADAFEDGYVLTDASILLLKDNPLSVTPLSLAVLDPVLTKPWYELSNWFKNDDLTAFNIVHGKTLWKYAEEEPRINHMFNEAMASDARLVTRVVIENCEGVFKGLESLVDVGGGTGTFVKAIAKAFPEIQCTVFDLPHVVCSLSLQDNENIKFVGGDMFEAIPPAHALLLKWILHDWNDEECVKILKKCKEAIASKGKEGKLIIIDMVLDNEKTDYESVQTQLFFDMQMMVLVTGKERNKKEWANLIFSAGFSDYKITPILGLRSLIELSP